MANDTQLQHDNYAFEMEAPKSPWRYPHLYIASKSPKFGKSRQQNRQPHQQSQQPPHEQQPRYGSRLEVPSLESAVRTMKQQQHQVEVQYHAAPRSLQHRQIKRSESTSSASSASSVAATRHKKARSRSTDERKQAGSWKERRGGEDDEVVVISRAAAVVVGDEEMTASAYFDEDEDEGNGTCDGGGCSGGTAIAATAASAVPGEVRVTCGGGSDDQDEVENTNL